METQANATDAERLLTAREVAELLGVPTTWVREQTRSGTMPHLKLGKYRRYDREAVLAWLGAYRAGHWRRHQPEAVRAA